MSARKSLKVLMVCLGNICRSPTAQGVLSALIKRRKLCDYLEVDSAGTGCWHLGEKPDRRSISAAQVRGYDLGALIARQVKIMDFAKFDYILAMDSNNLRDLDKICPNEYKDKLDLLLKFGSSPKIVVPDPFYGESSDFELVLDLVEDACEGFLEHVILSHSLS
tara:strand:+ start:72 stop:563 length:492 start_codon:yes stop_codon:yes gene_type:complete